MLERLSRLSPRFRTTILLGLEFLVAGDIIRTVVVHPTLDNLIVLAIIVVIRTFLSVTLQLEVEGPLALAAPGRLQHEGRANKGGGRSGGALNSGAGVELAAVSGSLSGNEEAPRRPATADGSSSQLDRSFFEIASKVPEFTLT
jgi:hypothetical protein